MVEASDPTPEFQIMDMEELSPTDVNRRETSSSSLATKRLEGTRKARACTACRSLKIKCRMNNDKPPCLRCKTRSISCSFGKSFRVLMNQEEQWKANLEEQVGQLQSAVCVLLRQLDLPNLQSFRLDQTATEKQNGEVTHRSNTNTRNVEDLAIELSSGAPRPPRSDSNIFDQPMSSLYNVTRLHALRDVGEPPDYKDSERNINTDFITSGLISVGQAQVMFTYFQEKLNPMIYGVLCPYKSLDSLRRGSTLLTISICTVAALHEPSCSDIFERCHREFLSVVSSTMFSRSPSLDDLRASITGAFWLSNTSWTLCGHAIRIATSLRFHHACRKALQNSVEDFEKARLWNLLYIVDHQASILYGLPPSIHESETLRQWSRFTECELATEADVRMASQISLFLITSRVSDMFGSDVDQPIPTTIGNILSRFNTELDCWLFFWAQKLERNQYLGDFPRDGVLLHYHFAKIHLCSYAFRGITFNNAQTMSPELKEFADITIASANSALGLVLYRPSLRNALVNVHVYFQAMIAFTAVFVLKVATTFDPPIVADVDAEFKLIDELVTVLKASKVAPQHLVYHIADGLEKLLWNCRNAPRRDGTQQPNMWPFSARQEVDLALNSNNIEDVEGEAQLSMDYFDFLMPLDSFFDPQPQENDALGTVA